MANCVDPEQTAPIGAVCSGSTLFVSILNLSVILGNFFAADDFSRLQFLMCFFLGSLRVNKRPVHLWAFGSGELKETVRHVYLSPVFISMTVTEITKEPVSTSASSLV